MPEMKSVGLSPRGEVDITFVRYCIILKYLSQKASRRPSRPYHRPSHHRIDFRLSRRHPRKQTKSGMAWATVVGWVLSQVGGNQFNGQVDVQSVWCDHHSLARRQTISRDERGFELSGSREVSKWCHLSIQHMQPAFYCISYAHPASINPRSPPPSPTERTQAKHSSASIATLL
jgi:hypothetical protein